MRDVNAHPFRGQLLLEMSGAGVNGEQAQSIDDRREEGPGPEGADPRQAPSIIR